MRLNPDIVRGVLLTVEEKCDFNNTWTYERDNYESEYLAELTHDEIIYHISQCYKAGLLDFVEYADMGDSAEISDLSPAGHEFLANIRDDTFFDKIKNIGKEIGTNSLKDLTQIAASCATLIIKSHFNLL